MKELKQEGDGTLLSDVGKSIKRGRTTVIEYLFLEGLVLSHTNLPGAKDKVDTAVTSMDTAELTQEDINSNIWSFSSSVLQGQPLK